LENGKNPQDKIKKIKDKKVKEKKVMTPKQIPIDRKLMMI